MLRGLRVNYSSGTLVIDVVLLNEPTYSNVANTVIILSKAKSELTRISFSDGVKDQCSKLLRLSGLLFRLFFV
jgi:hypothetical protein